MFRFQLVSISGIKFDEEVDEVVLPTADGQIGVMTGHMPLISVARTGVIAVRRQPNERDDDREFFATNGGVIEVADGELRVLVDEADNAHEINEAEAQKAFERAKQMKAEAKDQVSLEHAQHLIDRHEVRLHVAGLKRRRGKH